MRKLLNALLFGILFIGCSLLPDYLHPPKSKSTSSLRTATGLSIGLNTVYFPRGEASAQELTELRISPRVLYVDGKTFFVWQEEDFGKIYVLVYDDEFGVGRPTGVIGRITIIDHHHRPALFYDNGVMYILVGSKHDDEPLRILKARDSDLSTYKLSPYNIASTTPNYNPSYPKPAKRNGIYINLNQFVSNGGFNINTGSSFDGTWSDNIKIAEHDNAIAHYITQVRNSQVVTDKLIFIIGIRASSPPYAWYQKCLVKLKPEVSGYTLYNWDESFSKSSTLTVAELYDHFLYYETDNDTKQGFMPVACMDDELNFYDISGDGEGGYDFIYQMAGDDSVYVKPMNIPDSLVVASPYSDETDMAGQMGAAMALIAISDDVVEPFMRVYDGSFARAYRYRTTDLGDSWTFVDDVFGDVAANISSVEPPFNLSDIPDNKNFAICFTDGAPVSQLAGVGMKVAAFGSIQADEGDPFAITPFTESEYNALMYRSYWVKPGMIINTGTTLNGLIDQSPSAQNATAVGSPVINNAATPTFATFNGTNNALSIPIAGLDTMREGTIIFVAKGRTNKLTRFFNWTTNVSNSGSHHSFEKTANAEMEYYFNGGVRVAGKTAVPNDYNIYVYQFKNDIGEADAGATVSMYLNGELQLRNPYNTSVNEGRLCTGLTNPITHIEWGRYVRSSAPLWYANDMKHIGVSRTLNETEIRKAVKFVSNETGIPLTSHYQ